MSTLRNLSVNLELGQTILVGSNREPATITKIEFHEKSGEININTTKGPRKVLNFALCDRATHKGEGDESLTDRANKYR